MSTSGSDGLLPWRHWLSGWGRTGCVWWSITWVILISRHQWVWAAHLRKQDGAACSLQFCMSTEVKTVFSYLLPGIIVIYLYPPKVKALSRASGRLLLLFCCCNSVQFSRSVVSNSLQPHELQHARPPCPSPTPGVHSNSRPSTCCCNRRIPKHLNCLFNEFSPKIIVTIR